MPTPRAEQRKKPMRKSAEEQIAEALRAIQFVRRTTPPSQRVVMELLLKPIEKALKDD